MTFRFLIFALGVSFLTSSCNDDEPMPTESFVLSPRTSYSIALGGKFADTLFFKNDTLRQWEYVTGTENLSGELYVFSVESDNKFSGYFHWTSSERSYDKRVVREVFSQWDTSDVTINQQITQLDSLRPTGGQLKSHMITLKNDTLDLLLDRSNLPFDIDNQSATSLNGYAGYTALQTVIEGHPDSTDFSYYRRFWNLRDLLIQD